jgi:hypothetical protein
MYRYGITPLMKDVKQVLQALKKRTGQQEITSRAQEQFTARNVLSGTTDFGLFRGHWVNQVTETVTVRGMSLDAGYVSFANAAGLDLKGLLLLPVQLTSYSFVADWFVNLSSYIGAGLPTLGWKHLGNALVTTRAVGNAYALTQVQNLIPSGYSVVSAPTGTIGVTRLTSTRGPLQPAALVSQSDYKFDQFTRAADLVALITSRFTAIAALAGPTRSRAFRDKEAYHRWAQQPDVR